MCGTDVVQDEKHVVLECSALEGVSRKYPDFLGACGEDMKKLMLSQSDHPACFVDECKIVF